MQSFHLKTSNYNGRSVYKGSSSEVVLKRDNKASLSLSLSLFSLPLYLSLHWGGRLNKVSERQASKGNINILTTFEVTKTIRVAAVRPLIHDQQRSYRGSHSHITIPDHTPRRSLRLRLINVLIWDDLPINGSVGPGECSIMCVCEVLTRRVKQ